MRLKNNKGITLVELLIGIALLGIISTIIFSMLNFGTKVHKMSLEEYQLQSSIRMALEKTNQIIRYSTALFAIPETSFQESNLTPGWHYFGVSEDKKEIINYRWDNTIAQHVKEVLVAHQNNISYNLRFEKISSHSEDNLLRFFVEASIDGTVYKKIDINSEIETFNTLQIINYGSDTNPATAVAYRGEDRQDSVIGHIAMVLDTSGSMAWNMAGNDSGPASTRRIAILKNEAKNLINGFAQESNIDISLVPFSTSANNPKPFRNARLETASLISDIDSLIAVGGTNTGDGIRRAYRGLQAHNSTLGPGITPSNYIIILVDGVTTFASVEKTSAINYVTHGNNILDHSSEYRNRSPWNSTGQIAGNGSSLDSHGTAYVDLIGSMIRNTNFAKVYVIGFSSRASDLLSVNDIANACGAPPERVFLAGDGNDLSVVFETIRYEIVNDLWHLKGPNL
ncbi:prepilin-type N-terminal cleavage/methylation domain-containing protein [Natranaerovirga pectinivora]|uniref:Prepilin-type N-terminal cleavage/methylation domain-containing protein n=1 Tax=Natranaerovirga pectinivora TaxID=682400 RepID=A0A4R3MT58_9FIRM|nr:VWA domain-containing protein [Natranaerovirga pectinivora]TCT16900.1 prepilin-type N-terminal cleavage/methylation domain-containing protein [Natranaerovirga pectinivora]